MAKVILDSTDTQYTIANNNVEVKGASGNQTIVVNSGVTGLSLDSTIEDVDFAGNVADFTFSQDGAGNLTVLDSSGNAIATVSGANGKTLSFADGTVALETTFDATTGTGGINLGGTAVGTTAAAVVPATIDATDVSTSTGGTTTPVEGQTYTLTTSTTSTDILTGTTGNDTFDASTLDSLQANDLLVDGTSTDTDILNATISSLTSTDKPTVTGIETVNLNAKYGTASVSLEKFTGTKTLTGTSDIAAGTLTLADADITSVENIVAGTGITSVSVTAQSTGTGGALNVDSGSASSVTLTGGSAADTFDLVIGSGASATLDGNAGTDTYNLTLAGGTTTVTGSTNNEVVNFVSNGSANTVSVNTALTAQSSSGSVTVTGDQDLLIKATNSTQLNAVTVTDALTSGSLTYQLTTTTNNDNLAKVQSDQIELVGHGAHSVTFADGTNLKLSQNDTTTDLDLNATSSSQTINLLLNGNASVTDGATFFNTVTVDTTKNAELKAVLDATTSGAVIDVNGSNNVTMTAGSTAKSLDASDLTGKLTVTLNTGMLQTTGGSANDTFNLADTTSLAYVAVGGAGDDTFSSALATAQANTKLTIDGGEGTDTFKITAGLSLEAAGAEDTVITGVEVIDLNGQDLILSQTQGFTLGDTFTVKGTAATDFFTVAVQAAADAAGSPVVDLSGVTVNGTATLLIDAASATESTTLTGSSTVSTTFQGGDNVDTIIGGSANDIIAAGAGKDVLTGGAGADKFVFDAKANTTGAAGANVSKITDFVAGTDKFTFDIGADLYVDSAGTGITGDSASLGGLTLVAGTTTVATMAGEIASTTSVATISDVYTQLASVLNINNLIASGAGAGGVIAQVVEFTTGTAAGKYLVINDDAAGFQAANDIVVDITGVAGTVSAADFEFV